MDTWNGETQQATKAVAFCQWMPLHRTSRWFHVVHLCEPTSPGGWHFWHCELQKIFHVTWLHVRLSENLKYLRRLSTTRIGENDWKISLTGPRLDSLFSQRVSRKSDAHLLLKWDVPNLNSIVVCDVAVHIKWYKSPHPGMNSTGMQPALLITLPANQQRLLSETFINQERLMQNENTPFDHFSYFEVSFISYLHLHTVYLVNLDKS